MHQFANNWAYPIPVCMHACTQYSQEQIPIYQKENLTNRCLYIGTYYSTCNVRTVGTCAIPQILRKDSLAKKGQKNYETTFRDLARSMDDSFQMLEKHN